MKTSIFVLLILEAFSWQHLVAPKENSNRTRYRPMEKDFANIIVSHLLDELHFLHENATASPPSNYSDYETTILPIDGHLPETTIRNTAAAASGKKFQTEQQGSSDHENVKTNFDFWVTDFNVANPHSREPDVMTDDDDVATLPSDSDTPQGPPFDSVSSPGPEVADAVPPAVPDSTTPSSTSISIDNLMPERPDTLSTISSTIPASSSNFPDAVPDSTLLQSTTDQTDPKLLLTTTPAIFSESSSSTVTTTTADASAASEQETETRPPATPPFFRPSSQVEDERIPTVPGPIPGSIPIGKFNCQERNPCTRENAEMSWFFFSHEDPYLFVHCDFSQNCYILSCPQGLPWNQVDFNCGRFPWRRV